MSVKLPVILAVGANPAWQKVLQFDNLQHNSVNRASALWSFASGKGINFARAGRNWQRAEIQLLQFSGGDNGRLLMDDLCRENLQVHNIVSENPTRCCITCLSAHDNSMTELIEPSQAPAPSEQQQALEFFRTQLLQADAAALCGQLPTGMDIDFYCRCAAMAASQGKLLLIDSWKNIAPVLQKASNAILKINAEESAMLTGINDICQALATLFSGSRLEYTAITNGAEQAYFARRQSGVWRYTLPALPQVVNPVGSGDTASAVLLSEMVNQTPPEQAFALAQAAASANCLCMKCGEFDRNKALEIYENIKIEKLS